MKQSISIAAMLLLLLISCGRKAPVADKDYQSLDTDSRSFDWDYQSLEEAELMIINLYDSIYDDNYEGYRFNEELVDLVLNDTATLSYPFTMLQDSGYVSIETSADGKLRCYSWNDYSGGTYISFRDIVQFRSGDKVYAFNKSILDLKDDDPDDNYDSGCAVQDIYTLETTEGSPIYLVYTYIRESSNWGYSAVHAVKIEGDKIKPVNLFVGREDQTAIGSEYTIADWYFTANDGEGWDWIFKFDPETQSLYRPIAEHEITDQYEVYRFDGKQMVNTGRDGGFWLHPSLRKFNRLHYLYETEEYRIRVDEMDDGTYRYASWLAGQKMTDKPQIVIYNGRLNDDEGKSCIFENNGYKYIVDKEHVTIINPKNAVILQQEKKPRYLF